MVRSPQILTLLLKRFDFNYSTKSYSKSSRYVNMPLVLDIKVSLPKTSITILLFYLLTFLDYDSLTNFKIIQNHNKRKPKTSKVPLLHIINCTFVLSLCTICMKQILISINLNPLTLTLTLNKSTTLLYLSVILLFPQH